MVKSYLFFICLCRWVKCLPATSDHFRLPGSRCWRMYTLATITTTTISIILDSLRPSLPFYSNVSYFEPFIPLLVPLFIPPFFAVRHEKNTLLLRWNAPLLCCCFCFIFSFSFSSSFSSSRVPIAKFLFHNRCRLHQSVYYSGNMSLYTSKHTHPND